MTDLQPSELGAVFVYHPLGPQDPLYSAFASWTQPAGQEGAPVADDRARLLGRYRPFALHRSRGGNPAVSVTIPANLDEDRRELTRKFRAFFPSFLCGTDLQVLAPRIALVFPAVDVYDARCLRVDDRPAVFVTSRMLDVIELFANTLSLCVRLNGLAAPYLLSMEDTPPEFVLLAWMALVAGDVPYITSLHDLLEGRSDGQELERALRVKLLHTRFDWMTAEANRALSYYQLSHYLCQLMLRAAQRVVRGDGWELLEYLKVTESIPCRSSLSVDSRYLATLILSFIVLHEVGHLVLRHNEFEPVEDWSELVEAVKREAREVESIVNVRDFSNTPPSYELAADNFALQVVNEQSRGPLLEAATLWCAALASTCANSLDWMDHAFVSGSTSEHPAYAMRVWYLNGRFSSGRRAGPIARTITRLAEWLGDQLSKDVPSPEQPTEVFRALWGIARQETDLR